MFLLPVIYLKSYAIVNITKEYYLLQSKGGSIIIKHHSAINASDSYLYST